MNRALKSALIELKNKGVTLDPIADLEHILTLNTLSLDMSTPRNSPGESASFAPALRVGNVTLYRLTLGARRFLVDVAEEWFRGDIAMQDLVYAYCMAIGREPERLWADQADRRAFLKNVRSWEKTVGVSFFELRKAIQGFLADGQAEPHANTGPGDYRAAIALLNGWRPLPDPYKTECEMALIANRAERDDSVGLYGRTIEVLILEYGRTPEDWIWRTPENEIDLLLHNRRERLDADARELQGAQDNRFMRAHRAFCEYKDMVVRIKKGVVQ